MCQDFYFFLFYFYLYKGGYVEFIIEFNNLNNVKRVIARYFLLITHAQQFCKSEVLSIAFDFIFFGFVFLFDWFSL